jgi:murein DD-endopeptidase MepM/ murein hydrolase activator NlpD
MLTFLEVAFKFPMYVQSFHQIGGMVYTTFKYLPAPNKDSFMPQVLYSLPFEETWLVVNGGVSKETSHSWAMATQRYAYDFIILDENGKSFSGDGVSVSDYYCYGKKILAPADGVVVEVKNGCKDSKIMGKGRLDPLIKDIRGNYVVIQHAENEYSFLAHLMPGSILVNEGQNVKREQLIAMCGNSGNTSEPHLHFHVQNGKSFFTSIGLPIHFQNINAVLFPRYSSYDKRPVRTETGINNTFVFRGQSVINNSFLSDRGR